MNKIYKKMWGAVLMVSALAACSPDSFDGPDSSAVPSAADYADHVTIQVDQATNYATFHFASAQGVTPVWVLDGGETFHSEFTFTKYYRKAGEYSVDFRVKNANGISADVITKTFTVEHTKMTGFGGMDAKSDYNLFKNATMQAPTFWYAPGWTQIDDPTYSRSGNDWTVKLPEATTDQWQAQMFITTDAAVKVGTHYDYSVIFTSNADHPHVTMKLGSASNSDFALCYEPNIKLKAGEPYCFYIHDVESTADINDIQLIFDFGGNADNAEISIENLALKETANDDGTIWPVPDEDNTNYVYNAETNLWLPVDKNNAYTLTYYYAPNWSPIDNPVVQGSNGTYTVKLPSPTWERWQAQVAFHTEVAAEADTEYDFSVTVRANQALGQVTAKLAQDDNDENFLTGTDGFFAVKAEEEHVFKVHNVTFTKGAADKVKLAFDFAPNPENTEIEISNIIFQKHME